MPPEPSNCAAIIRSASVGPRKMRSKPNATIASTKPEATNRKSPKVLLPSRRRHEHCLVFSELRCHRLVSIKAVDEERAAFVYACGKRPRKQTRHRAHRASSCPGGNTHPTGHKARSQRQSRVQRPPRDIRSGNDGLAQEARECAQQCAGR